MVKGVTDKLFRPKGTSRRVLTVEASNRPFDLEDIDADNLGEIDLDLFRQPQNPFFFDLIQRPYKIEDDYVATELFHDQEELELKEDVGVEVGYETHKGRELLKRCRDHRNGFKHRANKQGLILFVHPLYTLFERRQVLEPEPYRMAAMRYLANFCRLLTNRDRDKYALVLMEMPEHYAMFTSLLLEAGLVDDVVFTVYDKGIPLNRRQISNRVRGSREVVIGGSYLGHCVGGAVDTVAKSRQRNSILFAPEIVIPRNDGLFGGVVDAYISAVQGHRLGCNNWVSVASLCVRAKTYKD